MKYKNMKAKIVQLIDPDMYVNDTFDHKIALSFLSFNNQNAKSDPFVEIINLMNESIDDGTNPCLELIEQYYMVMRLRPSYSSRSSKIIVEFTNKLFTLGMIDASTLSNILMIRGLDDCYKFFVHINCDHVHKIVEHLKCNFPSKCFIEICIEMINNVVLDDAILLELLACKNESIMSSLIEKLKLTNFSVTQEHLSRACNIMPYSIVMVTYLLTKNLSLNSDDMRNICENCDCDFMLSTLEQTRFVVDKNVFQGVMNILCDDITKKLNICMHVGYVPDIDDVITGIRRGVEIPNIERFNLKLDMGVFGFCCDRHFYPNYTFVGVDHVMIELAKYCNRNNISGIRKILKNGYVPSVAFMDMIVKTDIRKSILYEFVNAGGKVSLDGLKSKFDMCDFKLIMGCIDDLCGDVKKKDEMIMLLSKKCDNNIEYDVDKFKSVVGVGKFFGVNDNVIFDDVKMLLWHKMYKDGWINGKYIVIPDVTVPIFNGHKYVKLCDFNHLVCAYLEHNHI